MGLKNTHTYVDRNRKGCREREEIDPKVEEIEERRDTRRRGKKKGLDKRKFILSIDRVWCSQVAYLPPLVEYTANTSCRGVKNCRYTSGTESIFTVFPWYQSALNTVQRGRQGVLVGKSQIVQYLTIRETEPFFPPPFLIIVLLLFESH